jgi:hypothetical protein
MPRRLDWDKVEKQERARRHGTVRAEADVAPPASIKHGHTQWTQENVRARFEKQREVLNAYRRLPASERIGRRQQVVAELRELFRKDREYLRDRKSPGLIYIDDSEELRSFKSLQSSYERAKAKSKPKRKR